MRTAVYETGLVGRPREVIQDRGREEMRTGAVKARGRIQALTDGSVACCAFGDAFSAPLVMHCRKVTSALLRQKYRPFVIVVVRSSSGFSGMAGPVERGLQRLCRTVGERGSMEEIKRAKMSRTNRRGEIVSGPGPAASH